MELTKQLNEIDWQSANKDLSEFGFALVPEVLSKQQCCDLIQSYQQESLFRKTIDMQRYRLGKGEYKYFGSPLPENMVALRSYLYEKLTYVANAWEQQLRSDIQYPAVHSEFLQQCQQKQQRFPTGLILRYEEGGFNRMHQDLYGEVFFPLQVAILLSKPKEDFTGGEMIFTEQSARIQTQASVVQPERGEMVIFATNYRPVQGKNGFKKTIVRHGVSKIQTGERFCLGIPFHDAKT